MKLSKLVILTFCVFCISVAPKSAMALPPVECGLDTVPMDACATVLLMMACPVEVNDLEEDCPAFIEFAIDFARAGARCTESNPDFFENLSPGTHDRLRLFIFTVAETYFECEEYSVAK